jgi:ligand-binding sensor domain-containing protein
VFRFISLLSASEKFKKQGKPLNRVKIMGKIQLTTLACIFLFSGMLGGQSFQFRNFGTENDLPSKVIYTINQGPDGYLWIGTTEGLSRFDGFKFYNIAFPDSATGRYPTSTLRDKNGNLWFGCNDGTLFYYKERELVKVSLTNSSAVSAVLEGPDGNIYAVAQRKSIFRINAARPSEAKTLFIPSDPYIFSACFTGGGELLLGTQENLLVSRVEKDSVVTISTIEGFDYSRIMSIHKMKDAESYLIGTDGNGIFRLKLENGKGSLSRFLDYPKLDLITVRSVSADSGNNIWISTAGSGAVEISFAGTIDSVRSVRFLDRSSGLAGDNVSQVFEDSEDNIWLGFNGDGLSMLTTESLKFFVPGKEGNTNNIIYINRLKGDYLLGTPAGFYLFNAAQDKTESFIPFLKQPGRNEISSYFIDNESNVWIGTKGSGLFVRNSSGIITQFYKSGDSGSDYITYISINDDNIWLATLNGVNIISRQTRQLKKSYNINNGLPQNSISQVLVSEGGNGYVATESDKLYMINPESGISVSGGSMYGILLNKIVALAEDNKHNIWAATQGNGVFRCFGDSVKSLNTSNGLLSNYTYSILADSENNIWIGHERGFSRYNPETDQVKTYRNDFARGGTCNSNAIFESPGGMIFIGTTEGLIMYDRSKDRIRQSAPVNNINFIAINDVEYQYQPVFSLPYRKRYNIKINFTGINFGDPEKVYYSTFMKNYDDDWTKISSSREMTYNLRDGKYEFNLLSVNEEGLTQENPLSLIINIKPPFWRTWWFIISMAALATAIVVLIIREREKAQKKIQQYLETELEARTQVVIKQKDEIEHQNLEITDSINYAKRIQSSILPDINKLKEQFEGAFIMLRPRDIVSGDFYWFDKFDDEKFILVCADSTGHGVPGAFMSMIGSTLLQDIVLRQRISKPSEILAMLDKQVFATLNQNLEAGISNDGMDIVVCEFTLKNRHVRFASAMRPVIIVMGGETYYVKGNRSSVGGQTVLEKYFDDQEYYLNEGDTIYLFSDGLPDQFGGPDGKKLKIARLKNLLSEISSLPIDKQEEILSKFYLDWKGNYDQVDDILFMGVKV